MRPMRALLQQVFSRKRTGMHICGNCTRSFPITPGIVIRAMQLSNTGMPLNNMAPANIIAGVFDYCRNRPNCFEKLKINFPIKPGTSLPVLTPNNLKK